MSISDDQNTIHTLADDYVDDATWSLEIDQDSVHDLLSTTDMGNSLSQNVFSWSFSTAGTNGQFKFDIPFTAEPTDKGISSTTQTELDLSLFYNRPAQGFESSESSRDLIGLLDLNEKVRADAAILAPT